MLETLDLQYVVMDIARELVSAERPLLIYGAGVRGAEAEAMAVRTISAVPMVATWGAADLMPDCGTFGTHGNRYGNLAVQNADYILCVGSRLDTKATGHPPSSFAPNARLVMVDIDQSELGKMGQIGRVLYRAILADAQGFLTMLDRQLMAFAQMEESWPMHRGWWAQIDQWKVGYPTPSDGPYAFVKRLGQFVSKDDVIVSDTGCALAWMMQAYPFKGERFIHAFNQTPMGYGLPAAIGAAFATGKRVVLITGDGGLSVNITEFATLAGHKLPVKVILFNNGAHAMCMSTQRMWLNSEYPATSKEGGLRFPDFRGVVAAYGIPVVDGVERLFCVEGPGFMQFDVDRTWDVVGQIKFGEPLIATGQVRKGSAVADLRAIFGR